MQPVAGQQRVIVCRLPRWGSHVDEATIEPLSFPTLERVVTIDFGGNVRRRWGSTPAIQREARVSGSTAGDPRSRPGYIAAI